jgi:hypothetical protein
MHRDWQLQELNMLEKSLVASSGDERWGNYYGGGRMLYREVWRDYLVMINSVVDDKIPAIRVEVSPLTLRIK